MDDKGSVAVAANDQEFTKNHKASTSNNKSLEAISKTPVVKQLPAPKDENPIEIENPDLANSIKADSSAMDQAPSQEAETVIAKPKPGHKVDSTAAVERAFRKAEELTEEELLAKYPWMRSCWPPPPGVGPEVAMQALEEIEEENRMTSGEEEERKPEDVRTGNK